MYRATKRLLAEHSRLLMLAVAAYVALWQFLLDSQPVAGVSGVRVWWAALCSVTLVNFCTWHVSAAALARRKDTVDQALYRFQRWQLLLSAVYVLGCGFRSILPRADVQRIILFDSWLSSVMVGRSVATVAELCFMAQCALLLNYLARDAGFRFGVVVSWLIVPLIAVAEVCSWAAVLTTSYLGNAVEESIWAITAALVIFSGVKLWSRSHPAFRPVLAVSLLLGIAYVAFMCAVDVPMYVSRWLADEASGREYLSLAQGLEDVWSSRIVTFEWDQWRTEIPWMSLYFSVAVWCSIALVHVPVIPSQARAERQPQFAVGE